MTIHDYNFAPDIDSRLWELAEAVCSGRATDEQYDILNELLVDEDAACFYATYLRMHGLLLWNWRDGVIPTNTVEETSGVTSSPLLPSIVPTFDDARGFSSSLLLGWPAAYLIAAVICGVGLTIAAFTYVSQPTDIARHSNHSNLQSPIRNSSSVVARITGTADCRWEKREGLGIRDRGLEEGSRSKDQGSRSKKLKSLNPQIPKSLVFLGDQFILSAGLMEITYNTGARVILQGPCTYEVDSAAGGFLTVGKLTARVEQGTKYGVRSTERVASGQRLVASESSLTTNHYPLTTNSNPQSLIPNPLFAVRTPTATITDLGTEFGVSVGRDGRTESYVFQGAVQVQVMEMDGRPGSNIRLSENESVCIEAGPDRSISKNVQAEVDSGAFVRPDHFRMLAGEKNLQKFLRWQSHRDWVCRDPALVAYYTFESPRPNEIAVLPNLSEVGRALDGRIDGAEWVDGRLPGKSALYFHGPGSGDKVALPSPERFQFTGAFSVAVWFKVVGFSSNWQALIAKGDNSWRLQQDYNSNRITFDTDYEPAMKDNHDILAGRTDVNDGRWHLAVAVYAPNETAARKQWYLDGRLEAESETPLPLHQNSEPVWLGANGMHPDREFQGMIDEVMIFARALSADEVQVMFDAGNPNPSDLPKGGGT